MQEKVKLVPILSIGEVDLMDNVRLPSIQKWFLHRIGFAAPVSPYGVCYLPIPNPKPVSVIVGKPLTIPHSDNPTNEQIYKVLYEYMCHINELFENHKDFCQIGLPTRKLQFLDFEGHKRELKDFPDYLENKIKNQHQHQNNDKHHHKHE